MSNFYVILPSNTAVEGNRTNAFRVRLPKKLQFNSQWSVGLAVLVYPHTWPSLGTTEPQFVRIVWKTGDQIDIPLPTQNFQNPDELLKKLKDSLYSGSQEMVSKLRTIQIDSMKINEEINSKMATFLSTIKSTPPTEGEVEMGAVEDVKQLERVHMQKLRAEAMSRMDPHDLIMLEKTRAMGLASWIEAFRHARFVCNFYFNAETQRFRIFLESNFVERLEMSAQLAYIMGFEQSVIRESTEARFVPDMKGGVSSFFIYAPGLIEPLIMGDVTAPIMRIVNIRGHSDENIEETYMPIQYHKLLVKEISDISIQIRTPSGVLMPFQYGNCTLTLHFKKDNYF